MLRLQTDVGATLLFKGPKGRFRYERGTKKAIGALRMLWSCHAVRCCCYAGGLRDVDLTS